MSIGKIFKCVFFYQSMQHRKIKIAQFFFYAATHYQVTRSAERQYPLNSPSNYASKECFFIAKITILTFSPLFTGISNNHVLTFNLTFISHLTLKKIEHSPEPSRYKLLIAAFRVLLRPLVSELAGVILIPQRRAFDWRPQRRAG